MLQFQNRTFNLCGFNCINFVEETSYLSEKLTVLKINPVKPVFVLLSELVSAESNFICTLRAHVNQLPRLFCNRLVWYRNRKTRLVSIKSNFIAIWSSGGGDDDQRERRAHAKEPWLLTLLFYIVFVATFLMLESCV